METEAHEAKGISHLGTPEAVELVPFEGGQLPALRSQGQGWLVLKPACEALGLDHSSQRKRLERRAWATVDRIATVGADGKCREMCCLRSDRVAMWLATLDTGRVSDRVSRQRLEAWQCHAADALDSWHRQSAPAVPSLMPPGQLFLRFAELAGLPAEAPRPERPKMWADASEIAEYFGFTSAAFAREQVRYPALQRLEKRGLWPVYEVYELYKAITYPGLSGYAPAWAWADVLDAVEVLAQRSRHGGVTPVEVCEAVQKYSKLTEQLYRGLRACLPKLEDRLPADHVRELFRNHEGCVIAGKSLHRVGRSKRWAVKRSELQSH